MNCQADDTSLRCSEKFCSSSLSPKPILIHFNFRSGHVKYVVMNKENHYTAISFLKTLQAQVSGKRSNVAVALSMFVS